MKFRIHNINLEHDELKGNPRGITRVVIAVWEDPESELVTCWVYGAGYGLKAAIASACKSIYGLDCKLSAQAIYKTAPDYYRRKAHQDSLTWDLY